MLQLVDADGAEIRVGDCFYYKDNPFKFDYYWELTGLEVAEKFWANEDRMAIRERRVEDGELFVMQTPLKGTQGALEGVRRVASCSECPRMFQCVFTGQPKALQAT